MNKTVSSIPKTPFFVKGTEVVNNSSNLDEIQLKKKRLSFKGYSNVLDAYSGQNFNECIKLLDIKNGSTLVIN